MINLSRPNEQAGLFITGATGFLGSQFLLRLLSEKFPLSALVRADSSSMAEKRIHIALKTAQASCDMDLPDNLHLVDAVVGDIRAHLCGVDPNVIERLRQREVAQIWHFASDLRFEQANRDRVWENNVEGARNTFALSRAMGVKRFVYISTAYTAGLSCGTVSEELHDIDGPFNNIYEESKCAAEHMLFEECGRAGIALTILRPSIVVGPRSTKRPDGTTTGLYGFVRAVQQLSANLSAFEGDLRLPATPEMEINFIPVDCVVDDMIALLKNNFGTQPIYHLTATRSVTAKQCWDVMTEAFGLRNVVLQPVGSFVPNQVERLLERRIGFFIDYINTSKKFCRELPSEWTIDVADFAAYVDASIGFAEAETAQYA